VGEVPIGFGDVDGDPSNGTNTVPEGAGEEPVVDDAAPRVEDFVEVFDEVFFEPGLVDVVADERFAEGVEELVAAEAPGNRVVVGPVVTRLEPPEHATAAIVKASTPSTVPILRTRGSAMSAAYPTPRRATPDPNVRPGRSWEASSSDEQIGQAIEVPSGGAEEIFVGRRAP
jgi:hypothetical protein